ncbi:MAG: hypothetical protein MJ095_02225 [Oscillospiraceae bacterium]|nr:hypothetical protein [Oscillospiraceae bacterium]
MKPYIVFKAGNDEYRLKITVESAIQLEDEINCSIVEGLNKLDEMRMMSKYIYAALYPLNDGITKENTYGIINEFLMHGGKTEDLLDIILEVMECSGYIRQEAVDASKKMRAQLMEKANALLS